MRVVAQVNTVLIRQFAAESTYLEMTFSVERWLGNLNVAETACTQIDVNLAALARLSEPRPCFTVMDVNVPDCI